MEERLKDKANELTILSDNTMIQRRYLCSILQEPELSEELKKLNERHNKKLLEILTKYGN